jgi:hypothetical protein
MSDPDTSASFKLFGAIVRPPPGADLESALADVDGLIAQVRADLREMEAMREEMATKLAAEHPPEA